MVISSINSFPGRFKGAGFEFNADQQDLFLAQKAILFYDEFPLFLTKYDWFNSVSLFGNVKVVLYCVGHAYL